MTSTFIDALQWPAMLLTVISVWWIGSESAPKRTFGFWCSLASNGLWTIWGIGDRAWAVIVMQVCLAVLNIRGGVKNQRESSGQS